MGERQAILARAARALVAPRPWPEPGPTGAVPGHDSCPPTSGAAMGTSAAGVRTPTSSRLPWIMPWIILYRGTGAATSRCSRATKSDLRNVKLMLHGVTLVLRVIKGSTAILGFSRFPLLLATLRKLANCQPARDLVAVNKSSEKRHNYWARGGRR